VTKKIYRRIKIRIYPLILISKSCSTIIILKD
jgi:hypothetical protein